MQSIHDLAAELSKALAQGQPLHELEDLLQNYQADDWQQFCDFVPNEYKRVPIFQDQNYEMRLLCWDGNMTSELHDHPEEGCILKVLAGNLIEERFSYEPMTLTKETPLAKGMVSYIHGKKGIHRIINPHPQRAVSLHCYAPAGYQPKFYPKTA